MNLRDELNPIDLPTFPYQVIDFATHEYDKSSTYIAITKSCNKLVLYIFIELETHGNPIMTYYWFAVGSLSPFSPTYNTLCDAFNSVDYNNCVAFKIPSIEIDERQKQIANIILNKESIYYELKTLQQQE